MSQKRSPEERHAASVTSKSTAVPPCAAPSNFGVPWQDAQRIASEVRGPVELLVIEDGNHIANNRPYRYRLRSADWMAARLGLPKI